MTGDLIPRTDIRIPVGHGDEIDAWIFLPDGPGPHPVVVMAHGIGGVKAAGLAPFAERFAAGGFAALVFDYRHWGRSSGQPRQLLSIRRQLEDYRTVLAWARAQEVFDTTRVFVWGTSFSGMHIVELAAGEAGLAGAIAQCPLVDGLAGVAKIPFTRGLRLTAHAVADVLGSALGRPPHYLQVSVPPGRLGVIATDDAMAGGEVARLGNAAHLRVTGGEKPQRHRIARQFVERGLQNGDRLVETPPPEMADAEAGEMEGFSRGARVKPQRHLEMFDREIGFAGNGVDPAAP